MLEKFLETNNPQKINKAYQKFLQKSPYNNVRKRDIKRANKIYERGLESLKSETVRTTFEFFENSDTLHGLVGFTQTNRPDLVFKLTPISCFDSIYWSDSIYAKDKKKLKEEPLLNWETYLGGNILTLNNYGGAFTLLLSTPNPDNLQNTRCLLYAQGNDSFAKYVNYIPQNGALSDLQVNGHMLKWKNIYAPVQKGDILLPIDSSTSMDELAPMIAESQQRLSLPISSKEAKKEIQMIDGMLGKRMYDIHKRKEN